ncbi:MAG: FkbM family methyltransferase [Verrucomicrobiota bacterium]|jgi:FkbM family methyltransferase
MNFIQKIGVLIRDPSKLAQYCCYTYSRLLHGNGIVVIPKGGRIRTSSFSEYLSVKILMPNRSELGMMQKFLEEGGEVFDLGANVGVWTVLMSKANPGVRVHSFEPNPSTFKLLKSNVEESQCGNVRLNLAAVSNTSGQLNFQVPKNAAIFGRVAPPVNGEDKEGRFSQIDSFSVPAIRLWEYCQSNSIDEIDFLKIDVEGHELAALEGLGRLLRERKVKAIYIETMKENHDRMGTNFLDLLKFINDCGYVFHVLSEDGSSGTAVALDQVRAHNHLCLPGVIMD